MSNEGNWISVSDRLPEKGEYVIIAQIAETIINRTRYALFNGKEFESVGSSIDGFHLCCSYYVDVIFWQPMPALPPNLIKC